MSETSVGLPRYQSHKIVEAGKITGFPPGEEGESDHALIMDLEGGYRVEVDDEYVLKHKPQIGGYYMLYKDGYESWSPAEAFKDGYRKPIEGYRQLSDSEVAMMNVIKGFGPSLDGLIDDLFEKGADPRWVSIGKTHLQQGLMALTRAVTKPDFF